VSQVERRYAPALPWVRAALMTVGTAWMLGAMSFAPSAVGWLAAAAAGALMLATPIAAVATSVVAMTLPVAAVSLVTGVVFAVIALASVTYLARHHGSVFLLVLAAAVGVVAGPAWAAAVLAGYLLGAPQGAVAALVACFAIEAAGLLTGAEFIGVLATGGTPPPYLSFDALPASLLSIGWVTAGLSSVSDEMNAVVEVLVGAENIPLLVIQPLIWSVGAAVAGSLRALPGAPKGLLRGAFAVIAGTAAVAAGSAFAIGLLGGAEPETGFLVAALASVIVALAVVAVSELVFTPRRVCPPARAVPSSMRSEDAEVDELLRLISTAEEELSSKHTTQATVMITDMKSFSAMTEEEGSFTSAKLVQRHRDLLLPVITEYKGSGKSTGGDGLVASFSSPKQAVKAAIAMQRTLEEYNRTHGDERDIWVRIGIASGEVVLDSGGRPFIGTALNLAARVMNLGDGGCIMVTRGVADASKQTASCLHSHGDFTLKNIAEPVEVIEVLWTDERTPTPPPRS